MNTFGQPVPVRDEKGEIVSERIPVVSRVTKNELGGNFGHDKRRRLVVSLKAGDIIAFRPERTRSDREVTATAAELYRVVVQWQVNRLNLERARERKAKKAERRINSRVAREDARLRRIAKLEAQD